MYLKTNSWTVLQSNAWSSNGFVSLINKFVLILAHIYVNKVSTHLSLLFALPTHKSSESYVNLLGPYALFIYVSYLYFRAIAYMLVP